MEEEEENASLTISLLGGSDDSLVATDVNIAVGWRITCIDAEEADFGQSDKDCDSTGTVTIGSDGRSVTLNVPIEDDSELEPDDNFDLEIISVSAGTRYTNRISSVSTQRVTIEDNEISDETFSPVTSPIPGSSSPNAQVRPRRSSTNTVPDNFEELIPKENVLDQNAENVDIPPAPNGVIFAIFTENGSSGHTVDISILDGSRNDHGDNEFFRGSEVCLSITDETRRAVRGRIVSLSLYHYDETDMAWERLDSRPGPGDLETHICGTVDGFSQFALGYPAPIERSNLSILLPPTGGVTLSLWVLFGSGLLGLAVVSGGVFGLRRRR